ncbi:hypothetical protein Y032_0053g2438 [Ancylostoma ceylanicum]|nr:hypothetical protein Y032_0053g2438 [Ancylostoma ceylanicum]
MDIVMLRDTGSACVIESLDASWRLLVVKVLAATITTVVNTFTLANLSNACCLMPTKKSPTGFEKVQDPSNEPADAAVNGRADLFKTTACYRDFSKNDSLHWNISPSANIKACKASGMVHTTTHQSLWYVVWLYSSSRGRPRTSNPFQTWSTMPCSINWIQPPNSKDPRYMEGRGKRKGRTFKVIPLPADVDRTTAAGRSQWKDVGKVGFDPNVLEQHPVKISGMFQNQQIRRMFISGGVSMFAETMRPCLEKHHGRVLSSFSEVVNKSIPFWDKARHLHTVYNSDPPEKVLRSHLKLA